MEERRLAGKEILRKWRGGILSLRRGFVGSLFWMRQYISGWRSFKYGQAMPGGNWGKSRKWGERSMMVKVDIIYYNFFMKLFRRELCCREKSPSWKIFETFPFVKWAHHEICFVKVDWIIQNSEIIVQPKKRNKFEVFYFPLGCEIYFSYFFPPFISREWC